MAGTSNGAWGSQGSSLPQGTGGMDRRAFLAQSAGVVALASLLPSLASGMVSLAGPVRVGLVGCGRQGRAILAELASFPDVTVAAVCDNDERRLDSGKRRVASAAGFASHQQMLDAGGLDAVFIATPTHQHRGIVEDCLKAGLHVYCEAPIAHTAEDCKAIVAAATAAKGKFQAGYLARANPVYDLARSFFRSDAVRDLVSMEASRARKTSLRTPANDPAQDKALNWILDTEVSTGLAGEWGSHQFDVFHWYLDRFPVSVRGSGGVRLHKDGREIPDTIECSLAFGDGATLTYNATLANSYQGMYELFRGTNAAIKLGWSHGWMFKEADAPTQGWEVYANRQQFHNDEGITLIAGATKLAEQGKLQQGVGLPHTALWYGVEAFLKTVSAGAPVVCTAEDGLRSTVVGIAAHEAVMSGRTVEIDRSLLG